MNTQQEKQRFKLAFNTVIKHYLRETWHNRKTSIPGFLLPAFGIVCIAYIPPLAIAKIVQTASEGGAKSLSDFTGLILIFAGSWLLGELLWRVGLHFMIIAETRGVERLNNRSLDELLKRDLSFFNDNFAGSLTKKTLAYANRYIDVMDTMTFNVVSKLLPVIFAAIVLAFYSPWLVVILFGLVATTIAIVLPLIKKRRDMVTERETASNIVSGHIADVYGNVAAVRAEAAERHELRRHRSLVADLVRKIKRSWDYQNQRIDVIISPLYVLTNALGLVYGLHLATTGQIEYSALIVIFAYYTTITSFMWEFNGVYRRLESALSDAAQFTELLQTDPGIIDAPAPQKLGERSGDINISNVHFAYDDGDDKLFDHFSLHIPAGQKVGLVGRSGGGKSSITKLLLRFVDIDEGSIKIDDTDIRHMSQSDLRSLIAYVPQDPVMFHRTIAENIAYAHPKASQSSIKHAAHMAHADEFIQKLKAGYETLVGERGIKLSGGQRQRIAIARAMLKDAPILLLDEATSALDSESELLIQDALRKLMEDKTAIVIAHRLSTIQKMDRIIVLDQGAVVEDGTHESLLKKNGTYAKLWAHQSGGFLED